MREPWHGCGGVSRPSFGQFAPVETVVHDSPITVQKSRNDRPTRTVIPVEIVAHHVTQRPDLHAAVQVEATHQTPHLQDANSASAH